MHMIVLAAGQGTRLRPLTDDRPKCMVPLKGRALIDWQLAAARDAGIADVAIVGGYRADALGNLGAKVYVNDAFETTNMVYSLWCARDALSGGAIISYGDIVCEPRLFREACNSKEDIGVVVDTGWLDYWRQRFADPADDAESLSLAPDGAIIDIGRKIDDVSGVDAQYIGLIRLSPAGAATVVEYLSSLFRSGEPPAPGAASMYMTDLLRNLIGGGARIGAIPVHRGWVEVDQTSDLELADAISRDRDGVLVFGGAAA